MGTVNTPPVERARLIFSDLGYTVSGDGPEFRAEREWKVVRVTALAETDETPTSGEYRCFVTYQENADALRRRLRDLDPEYEWAIISVGDDEEYDVVRAPPTLA